MPKGLKGNSCVRSAAYCFFLYLLLFFQVNVGKSTLGPKNGENEHPPPTVVSRLRSLTPTRKGRYKKVLFFF